MQRCWVSTLCVSAINIFGSDQSLNSCQVTFLRRIQQGSITPKKIGHVLVTFSHQVQGSGAISVLLARICPMLRYKKIK